MAKGRIIDLGELTSYDQNMDYRIKGFLETSFSDWRGKVVAVLFLPSCNFRCRYCHNHQLVLQPEKFPNFPPEEIFRRLMKRRGWIEGVCITGGEPTLHPWLPRLIRDLKSASELTLTGAPLEIKLDTNGTNPAVLGNLIDEGLIDYVAMDLKAPLDLPRYAMTAGVSLEAGGLEKIQSSIQILLRGKVDYEFRTTFVQGLMNEAEVCGLALRIQGARRYTLQNFNPTEALEENLRSVAPLDERNLAWLQQKVNEIIHPHLPPLPIYGYGFLTDGNRERQNPCDGNSRRFPDGSSARVKNWVSTRGLQSGGTLP